MESALRSERLRRKGAMLEKQQKLRSVESHTEALRARVREMLDPAIIRISEIDCESLMETTAQLALRIAEYSDLAADIRKLERALGD